MMKKLKHADLLYEVSQLSTKEIMIYETEGILLVILFGYFFYKSLLITMICLPLSFFYLIYKSKISQKKNKLNLQVEFKETLVSVSSSLRAGYSLENAFLEAEKEMYGFYGEKARIVKELSILRQGMKNSKSLTVLLTEMGNRTKVQEIIDFASILVIGKQTGGNLIEIIESFIHVAEEKNQVDQEIATIVSAKKYEQKIMNCVPFFIIFYIDVTSKGFFDVLYSSALGRIVMTVCLVIYICSVYISERITDIRI